MANEANKQWFRYVSDGGQNFGVLVDQDMGNNASFGLASFNAADPAWGPQSTQHRLRHAVYIDPATFRTKTVVVGTVAALASVPATLAVSLPGSATTETYNLKRRVGEKMRIPGPTRNLPDRTG
jgi:hypothetical protein